MQKILNSGAVRLTCDDPVCAAEVFGDSFESVVADATALGWRLDDHATCPDCQHSPMDDADRQQLEAKMGTVSRGDLVNAIIEARGDTMPGITDSPADLIDEERRIAAKRRQDEAARRREELALAEDTEKLRSNLALITEVDSLPWNDDTSWDPDDDQDEPEA